MPRRQITVRLVELFAGRVNKEPWFTFWVAAATGLFTCLSVFILTRWLALPDTPSGNYLFHDIPSGGLRVFLSFILPAASCLPSLAHAVMLGFLPASGGRTDPWPSRLDLVGSLALLLLIPLALLWRSLPHAFVLCGLLLLGIVALKGAALVRSLAKSLAKHPGGGNLGLRMGMMIWLAAFSLLAPMSIWVWQAYSAAGDEVRYLMITHSVAHYGTSDVRDAVARQEYRKFYTGPWHPKMSWTLKRAGTYAFHLIMVPAYLAGGRLGSMLFMAALTALAVVGLMLWLLRCGLSPPAAGAAALLCIASVPVLSLSQHVLPDVPGILLFTAGLLVLQRFAKAPVKAWAGLLAVVLGLILLKNRLAFMGAGLLLAGAVEQWIWFYKNRRKLAYIWAGISLFSGIALAGIAYYSDLLLWDVAKFWAVYLNDWKAAASFWHPVGVFLAGMGLDQEHGILLLAPIFLLALAALPAACVRLPGPARQALVPALFYLAVLCFTRWGWFYGGDGPPGRFITVTLPAFSLFIGFAWQHLQQKGLRVIPMLLGGFTLTASLVLTLIPSAHFHRTTGMNKLLGLAGRWWGHDLHHMFPSSFAIDAWLTPWLAGGAVLVLGLGWAVWRSSSTPSEARPAWRAWEAWLAAVIVAGCLAAPLSLSLISPPVSLEAEQMDGHKASLFAKSAGSDGIIGRSLASGGDVHGRMYYPGGGRQLKVVGFCEQPGRLSLLVNGRSAGELDCIPGQPMVFTLSRPESGYLELELRWNSCGKRSCFLFIDRLRLI